MATINLATKYSDKLVEKFTKESYLAGKANQDYDFAGVRSITVYTIETQDLNDYSRTASANRFGTPTEIKDTIQELVMSQDKSFSITIDKGNQSDQLYIKDAGKVMKLQLAEKNIPFMDKYALNKWAQNAGKIAILPLPTAANVIASLADALTALDNALVPDDGRFIFVGASIYNKIRMSTELLSVDPLAVKSLGRGIVGELFGSMLVKVPDSYLGNAHFIIAHRSALLFPLKFKTLNLHTKAPGIDGALLEGRHYFDAFVLGAKADSVYVAAATANIQAVVTITATGASHALVSTGSSHIKYTLDGSDPRFSTTAVQVATGAAVVLTNPQTIKAVAFHATKFTSAVAEATYTG